MCTCTSTVNGGPVKRLLRTWYMQDPYNCCARWAGPPVQYRCLRKKTTVLIDSDITQCAFRPVFCGLKLLSSYIALCTGGRFFFADTGIRSPRLKRYEKGRGNNYKGHNQYVGFATKCPAHSSKEEGLVWRMPY